MDVFFILSVCFPSVPDLAAASSFFCTYTGTGGELFSKVL